MSTNYGQQVYSQSTGLASTVLLDAVRELRDPTNKDFNFPLGKFWVNTATDSVFYYANQSTIGGQISAIWVELAVGSGGALNTLTGDVGGAVSPILSNIDILGNLDLNFAGSPGTLTATNQTKATPFVVGATGYAYSTVQSAVTAAGAAYVATGFPQLVYVTAGQYTENVVLVDGITIQGTGSSVILGNMSFSGVTGHVSFFDLDIGATNGSPVIMFHTSGSGNLNFTNCQIQGSGGSQWFDLDLGAGDLNFVADNCFFAAGGNTNVSVGTITNASVFIKDSFMIANSGCWIDVHNNSGFNLISGLTGIGVILNDNSSSAIFNAGSIGGATSYAILNGTSNLSVLSSTISASAACVVLNDTASANIRYSSLVSNSAAAITIAAGASVTSDFMTILQATGTPITGTGSFDYDHLGFQTGVTASVDPGLTTTILTTLPTASAGTFATATVGHASFDASSFGVSSAGFVTLNNTMKGSTTTTNAVPQTILTIPIPTSSTISYHVQASAFESTGPSGYGSLYFGVARNGTSGTGVVIGGNVQTFDADTPLVTANVSATIDGTGNNVLIQVTGVALLTLTWNATATIQTA